MSSVKFPNLFRGMFQIARRFPGVFSFTIASPTDKILESTTKELRVSDVVDFVLFFAVDCNWIRGRRRQAIYIVPFVRAEAIHMEYIVDFEGQWERQSVVHITDDFSDFEWTKLLRTQLRRLLVYLDLLCLKPYFVPNFECRCSIELRRPSFICSLLKRRAASASILKEWRC